MVRWYFFLTSTQGGSQNRLRHTHFPILIRKVWQLEHQRIVNGAFGRFQSLKNKFPKERKFSYYLLGHMPKEGQVKFGSSRKISGASQQNRVAAFH